MAEFSGNEIETEIDGSSSSTDPPNPPPNTDESNPASSLSTSHEFYHTVREDSNSIWTPSPEESDQQQNIMGNDQLDASSVEEIGDVKLRIGIALRLLEALALLLNLPSVTVSVLAQTSD